MQVKLNLDTIFVAFSDGLSENQLAVLEQKVAANSVDVQSRCELLAFYRNRCLISEEHKASFHNHLLWMVQDIPNLPFEFSQMILFLEVEDDEILIDRVKEVWDKHIAGSKVDKQTILNAVYCFLNFDDLPEHYLNIGQRKYSDDKVWALELKMIAERRRKLKDKKSK